MFESAVISEIFVVISELAITSRIPAKEARAEIESHPVTVQARISKCSVQFKILKTFTFQHKFNKSNMKVSSYY